MQHLIHRNLLLSIMRAFHLALFMVTWMASEAQDTNYLPHDQHHPDIVDVVPVVGANPGGISWANSYSVDDRCYCVSTLENRIAQYPIETPLGWMTVKEVCDMLGKGPGVSGHPIYNDVQCRNGPPNYTGDEHTCPGRVDIGKNGCGQIGPTWSFGAISMLPEPLPAVQDNFYRDAGTNNEDTSIITGKSWVYMAPATIAVKGTSQPDAFRSHRSGSTFSYLVENLNAERLYTVSLGFAEVWTPNCKTAARVQKITINDNVVNDNLDVYKEAGCATAYVENYEIAANGLGKIRITMTAIKENAMLSTIKIAPSSGKVVPPPPPPPPPPLAPAIQKVVIDAGSKDENMAFVAGVTWAFGKPTTPEIKGTSAPTFFRTHRSSDTPLKYTVPGLTAGASYAIKLGFAEIWKPNCQNGKRIMSIKLNGVIVTSNLDVFRAVGCEAAYLEDHVATANANGQIVIEVAASVEKAMISYISIVSAPGHYFLDTGADGDDISMVTGNVARYGNADTPTIAGTALSQVRFRTNRFGADFKYVIKSGFTPGKAYLLLGFPKFLPRHVLPVSENLALRSTGKLWRVAWTWPVQLGGVIRPW
jgi:hypothetical protein